MTGKELKFMLCFCANNKEINNYASIHHISSTHLLHCQVVYLVHEVKLNYDEISKITDYANSTIKSYSNKYYHLLEEAMSIFTKEFQEMVICSRQARGIHFDFLVEDQKPGHNINYFMKIYCADGEVLSKIGTTEKQTCFDRAKQHYDYYTNKAKRRLHITKIVIEAIMISDLPVEGFESFVRSMLIKKYPNDFVKNDRFLRNISKEEYLRFWEMYNKIEV